MIMKAKKLDFVAIGVLMAAVVAFTVFDQRQVQIGMQVQLQDTITCTDIDGTDLFVRGTSVSTLNGQETIYADECAGSDILKEYMCNGNRIANRLHKCSCLDGKCV